MGGGKGGTTTSSVTIPPEVLARYNSVNARAETAASGSFQPYTGQFVAGMTPTQQAGVANTNAAAKLAQPFYQAGTGLTMQGAQSVGPLTQGQIGYYQDPFTQSVVDPTRAALQQDQGQQRAQQQAQQIKSGAFGGDRAGLERANLARQQNLGMAQAIAPLYSQGYQTGVQTAVGQQGVISSDLQRKLAAGQQIAGLGTGAQGAALQGAQQQLAAGTAEQQTQQADLTAQYQQFLQQQGFPYQQAQFLANIAMGTGALSGSTTTTQAPTGFFSDRRLKHDVHEIGETHDGQPIYSYKYKGDDKTQIGLMAQDVEKHHPEAVGVMGGYKTVDYGKATEDSERPERATGGVIPNSMGGGVWHPDAYAGGGLVDGDDMKSILQAQQAGFGPFGGGVYGGSGAGTPGGKSPGIVPQASLPVPKLVTAGSPPARQASGLSQAASVGSNIASTGRAAIDFKNWVSGLGKDKPGATPERTQNGATTAPAGNKDIRVDQTGKLLPAGSDAPARPTNVYQGPTRTSDAGDLGGATQLASADIPSFGADDFSFAAARGGVIPFRHHRAGGGVNPYELPGDMSHIPSSVLKEGEEEADQAAGQFKKNASGGGGGGGGSSPFGDIAKVAGTAKTLFDLGTAAASMFSDERMKDNIRPVGKTFDGQKIYSYDMGDGRTQMGLLAQEVLHHKPEAVGKSHGYLTVDYSKATEDSAPHKAMGGVVPRHGYALDGAVDPTSDQPVYDRRSDMPSENAVETAARPDEKLVTPVKEISAPVDEAQAIIDRAREVHAQKESGGKYDILGPVIPRGTYAGQRPVGRYQVLEGNIGPWTKTALGKEMSPEEFRRDNNAQDAVFNKIWGDNYRKFGNVPDAVSMWASGRPAAEGAKTRDIVFGTSTGAYIDDATRKILGKDFKPSEPGVSREPPIGRGSTLGDVFKSITPDSIPTNENFWIPALAGVGSMLASSRPTLLGAVGEGLVGGVSGYQTMQKQHAEMAKGVMDLIKDRFVTGTDKNNNTTFYDKVLGKFVDPSHVQTVGASMLSNLGINPKSYGFGSEALGVSGASTSPSTTSGGPSAPPAPSAPVPTGTQVAAPVNGEKKPEAPPAINDDNLFGKSQSELIGIAEKRPDLFPGLTGDRDPLRLRAEINQMKERAERLSAQGQSAQAANERTLADEKQKLLNGYLEQAVSFQYKQNEKIADASAKTYGDYKTDVDKRAGNYSSHEIKLKRLADINADFQSGALAGAQSKLASYLKGTPLERMLPSDWMDQPGQYGEAYKIALVEALQAMSEDKLVRAPKVGVETEMARVPSPDNDPAAVYAIIGSTWGDVLKQKQMDADFAKAPPGTNPGDFAREWSKRNDITKFYRNAFSQITPHKNITPKYIQSLQETYRSPTTGETFTVPERKDATGAAPAKAAPSAPQLPEPLRGMEGLVFSPSRKQYRDNSGNVYDMNGKRVQ